MWIVEPGSGERVHMPFQERFLGLGAERDMERPPGVGQSQHEHPTLDQFPGDLGVELTEVDLGLRARRMGLWQRPRFVVLGNPFALVGVRRGMKLLVAILILFGAGACSSASATPSASATRSTPSVSSASSDQVRDYFSPPTPYPGRTWTKDGRDASGSVGHWARSRRPSRRRDSTSAIRTE